VTGTFNLSGADTKYVGAGAGDNLGNAVWSPGDVNDDGYADVMVGAVLADGTSGSNSGAIYTFTSRPSGVVSASTASSILYGEDTNDLIGHTYATGDVDGDGFVDILVGSSTNDDSASNAGCAWLVYGPLSGTMTLGSADAAWLGTSSNDALGSSVAIIPDTNSDGKDEVAIGGYAADERGYVDHGAVYVFNGE